MNDTRKHPEDGVICTCPLCCPVKYAIKPAGEHVPEPSTPPMPECHCPDMADMHDEDCPRLAWQLSISHAAPSHVPEVDAEREAREWLRRNSQVLMPKCPICDVIHTANCPKEDVFVELLAAYDRRMK